ncbi:Uu.00g059430.m01.CDS01 [Anthostomella pinea]|uniref:Uu.00g059430.m01.CDS01 n=1 Tax=Anthostomella pinea TaxID=933095 RepID=A0AAI8VS47_9PEZI|nr:Uu.00g059430.m01.CDS01 [Anthostomella pinea]
MDHRSFESMQQALGSMLRTRASSQPQPRPQPTQVPENPPYPEPFRSLHKCRKSDLPKLYVQNKNQLTRRMASALGVSFHSREGNASGANKLRCGSAPAGLEEHNIVQLTEYTDDYVESAVWTAKAFFADKSKSGCSRPFTWAVGPVRQPALEAALRIQGLVSVPGREERVLVLDLERHFWVLGPCVRVSPLPVLEPHVYTDRLGDEITVARVGGSSSNVADLEAWTTAHREHDIHIAPGSNHAHDKAEEIPIWAAHLVALPIDRAVLVAVTARHASKPGADMTIATAILHMSYGVATLSALNIHPDYRGDSQNHHNSKNTHGNTDDDDDGDDDGILGQIVEFALRHAYFCGYKIAMVTTPKPKPTTSKGVSSADSSLPRALQRAQDLGVMRTFAWTPPTAAFRTPPAACTRLAQGDVEGWVVVEEDEENDVVMVIRKNGQAVAELLLRAETEGGSESQAAGEPDGGLDDWEVVDGLF